MRYRFGSFELDEQLRELRRLGLQVHAQPRIVDLILYLLINRDRIVSKEELLDELWSEAIVGEAVLTTAVSKARGVLDDTSDKRWCIETIPKRGYRFVADVEGLADGHDSDAPPAPQPPSLPAAGAHRKPSTVDAFVGREDALRTLTERFEAASAGCGSVVLISGAPGIGKTRACHQLGGIAREAGAEVLAGWCDVDQGAPPYWPWMQILRSVIEARDAETLGIEAGPGVADIAAICPEIALKLPSVPIPALLEPSQARFRFFDSVKTLLTNAAKKHPLVLIFDDLQWADRSSLRVLELLSRHLASHAILIVGTYRDLEVAEGHPLEEAIAEMSRHADVMESRLSGLSVSEAHQLIRQLAGEDPPVAFAQSVAEVTEGNPFFIKEIVRSALGSGAAAGREHSRDWTLTIPRNVRTMILQRLRPLPAECRTILDIGAVVGREFSLELVARVASVEVPDCLDGLEAAQRASVVEVDRGRFRFVHALIQEAIYASQSPAARGRIHLAVAECLEQQSSDELEDHLPEIARHLVSALPRASAERAIDALRRAGDRAMSLHAYDEAKRHFASALDVFGVSGAPDSSTHCELLLSCARAESAADGLDARSRAHFLEAAQIARQSGSVRHLAVSALIFGSHVNEAASGDAAIIGLHEEALNALRDERSSIRARLMGRLAVELSGPGSYERAGTLLDEALAIARETGERHAIAEILNQRIYHLSGPGRAGDRLSTANELLELGNELGSLRLVAYGLCWRIASYLDEGDVEAVDREMRALASTVDEERGAENRWRLNSLRIGRALMNGQLEQAEKLVAQGREMMEYASSTIEANVTATQLCYIRRELGRLQELKAFVLGSVEVPRDHPSHWAYSSSVVLLYSELGELDTTRKALDDYPIDEFLDQPRALAHLFSLCSLAEAAATAKSVTIGHRLYVALLPFAGRNVVTGMGGICLGSASRQLSLLASMLGRHDEAVEHGDAAIREDRALGARLWLAHSRVAAARARIVRDAAGDAEVARELLSACLAESRELGFVMLADRAETLLAGRG